MIEDVPSLEIGPREYVHEVPGCFLIHHAPAGASWCDAA